MDLMTYLLATKNGGGGSGLPEVTSADNGKILKVKDGEWGTGEDISGDKLPPVSSTDNGKVLKVVDAEWNIGEDEGGIEAIELTQSQYDELSTAEKEDPTKVYFINTGTPTLDPQYAYHTNQDETLIYRCKADDGSEGMWFLNGFEVTSLTNTAIPTELRQYAPGGNGKVSDAWADTNGTPFLVGGKQCYTGIYNNTVRIWSNNGTTNQLGTVYAVIDMRLDNRQYNEWSDPYIYTTNRNHKIYYKDIKYSVSIPDSTIFNNGKILRIVNGAWSIDDETTELPEVTGSDNGKILKVTEGQWAKGDAPTELPSVSSSDNGKILKVMEGQWAKGDAPESIQVGNATGDIVSFNDGADDILMPKLIVSIEPQQSGSGDPSPENVRPISGWTEANVSVNDGQNLFGGTFNTLFPLFIAKNTRITVSAKTQTNFAVFDKDKNQIDYWGLYDVDATTGRYYRTFNFQYDIYYVEFIYTSAEELQIKYGTDVTYSAYNGNTYTINFVDGSSPLTVYGGTLDVLSGVLTVDRAYVDMSEITAEYNSGWNCWTISTSVLPNAKIIDNNNTPTTAISDRLKAVKASGYTTSHESGTMAQNTSNMWFIDNGSTTELSGQLVYELATPQTYQLTPTEVKSLLEKNVIYADAGKVTVTYYKHSEALEDMDILFSKLPNVNTTDNGKILKVTNGAWSKGESDAYISLTQAQYDALPSSKLTDGKMYCITDQDGNVVTQSPTITNADYEILFSGTADNTEHAEIVRKTTGFIFNPNTTTAFMGIKAIGDWTPGSYSFGTGYFIKVSGDYSHAEGYQTIASGNHSHAEGYYTTASGEYGSHAEGGSTTASGSTSHAEGGSTTASGSTSHAEGGSTTASGMCSHAEGGYTIASGYTSHAEGLYTTANHRSQHTFGEFNTLDTSQAAATEIGNYIEIVGNGTADNARSNARTLDWSGNEWVAGTYTNGSSRKIKTNIESLTNTEALKILDLNPVKFDFIKTETNDQRERGFIAEEVMNVIPQIAFEEETDNEGNITKPASLNYIGLIPYLVKMIQIQQQEIDKLKEQINN